ncbi:MAG: hypothetical protein JJ902_11540 [Roseibium sp.]|nr:hypothetical protein [Roseibium sp.]
MYGPCHWHHRTGPAYFTHRHWRHQHYRDGEGVWHERPCGPDIEFVLWFIPWRIRF